MFSLYPYRERLSLTLLVKEIKQKASVTYMGVLEGAQLAHGLCRGHCGVRTGSHYGPGFFNLSARTEGTHDPGSICLLAVSRTLLTLGHLAVARGLLDRTQASEVPPSPHPVHSHSQGSADTLSIC